MQKFEALEQELTAAITAAVDIDGLEKVRVSAMGRKGKITQLMRGLGEIEDNTRKDLASALNLMKGRIGVAIEGRRKELEAAALEERLSREIVDLTLPVRWEREGRIHPISQVLDEVVSIFSDMGFGVVEGPDIEDDFHNFTALNIPPEHPARQMVDTFYFAEKENGDRRLLRTHTSPVQIRSMRKNPPPHRIIVPGRTYRRDSDNTHTPMFHQVEGLLIDEATHLGHLKSCLFTFARTFFEVDNLRMRFRPSYFPFTEPSAEVDIGCSYREGEIRIGEGKDWLEILGSGMVHPKVLEHCGLDPDVFQGFAFGIGIDRIAMLKYGMPDLRAFFESDLRWLRHYGFSPLDIPTLAGRVVR